MKAVDLGLSVYWGENILITPNKHFEENLFTWGDDSYNNAHNKACKEDDYEELADSGIITDDGFLTPQYDHAYQILGDKWRMPTVEEFKELMNKCQWRWVGDGFAIIGSTNNSIKMPRTSFYTNLEGIVETGHFWTNEPSFEEDSELGFMNEAYSFVFSISEAGSRMNILPNKRDRKISILSVTTDISLLKDSDANLIKPLRPSFIAPDAWINDYTDNESE
jgi:hypothetical protein